MKTTKDLYNLNFKDGFDIERFRWSMVLLWGITGLIVGAGLGATVDYGE